MPCLAYMGASGNVTSSGSRMPNGTQIREGMNVKSARGSSTTTSCRASRRLRNSRAAVMPAKLDPTTTTRDAVAGLVDKVRPSGF